MLILQRRVGQRIVVSGGIEITVTAVTKRGVRLAVSAPRGVTVLRGEVHDAVAQANAQAADWEGAPFGTEEVLLVSDAPPGTLEEAGNVGSSLEDAADGCAMATEAEVTGLPGDMRRT